MSDLEQHALLLPFFWGGGESFCTALDPEIFSPAGLIALAGSFFIGTQRVSAPVTCHLSPSPAYMLIH